MEIKLTTEDIQYLILALVLTNANIPCEKYSHLDELLCRLNRKCNLENNYTLTLTLKEDVI